jgi:hypothetical protein
MGNQIGKDAAKGCGMICSGIEISTIEKDAERANITNDLIATFSTRRCFGIK